MVLKTVIQNIFCSFLLAAFTCFFGGVLFAPPAEEEAYKAKLQQAFDTHKTFMPADGAVSGSAMGGVSKSATVTDWPGEIINAKKKEQEFRAKAMADPENRAAWTKLADTMSQAQQAFAKVIVTINSDGSTKQAEFETKKSALKAEVDELVAGTNSNTNPQKLLNSHPLLGLKDLNTFLTNKKPLASGAGAGSTALVSYSVAETTTSRASASRTAPGAPQEVEQFQVYNLLTDPGALEIRAALEFHQKAQQELDAAKAAVKTNTGTERARLQAQANLLLTQGAFDETKRALDDAKTRQENVRRELADVEATFVKTSVAQQSAVKAILKDKKEAVSRAQNQATLNQKAATEFLKIRIQQNLDAHAALSGNSGSSSRAEMARLTQEISDDQKDLTLLRDADEVFSHLGSTGTSGDTISNRNSRLAAALKRAKETFAGAAGPARVAAQNDLERAQKNLDASNALARTEAKKNFEDQMLKAENSAAAKEKRAQGVILQAAAGDAALSFLATPGFKPRVSDVSEALKTSRVLQVKSWKQQLITLKNAYNLSTNKPYTASKIKLFDFLIANPDSREKMHAKLNALLPQISASKDVEITPEMRKRWYTDSSTAAIFRAELVKQQQVAQTSIPVEPDKKDSDTKSAQKARAVMENSELQRRFISAATITLQQELAEQEDEIVRITKMPKPTKDDTRSLQKALLKRKEIAQALATDPVNYLLRTPAVTVGPRNRAQELVENRFTQNLTAEFIQKKSVRGRFIRPFQKIIINGNVIDDLASGTDVSGLAAHLASISESSDLPEKDKPAHAFAFMKQVFGAIQADSLYQTKLVQMRKDVGAAYAQVLRFKGDAKTLEAKLTAAGVPAATAKAMSVAAGTAVSLDSARGANLAERLSKKVGQTVEGASVAAGANLAEKTKIAQQNAAARIAVAQDAGKAPESRVLSSDVAEIIRFVVVDEQGNPISQPGDVIFATKKPTIKAGQYLLAIRLNLNGVQDARTFKTIVDDAIKAGEIQGIAAVSEQGKQKIRTSVALAKELRNYAIGEHQRLQRANDAKRSAANKMQQALADAAVEADTTELDVLKRKFDADLALTLAFSPDQQKTKRAALKTKYAQDLSALAAAQLAKLKSAKPANLTLSEGESGYENVQRAAALAMAANNELAGVFNKNDAGFDVLQRKIATSQQVLEATLKPHVDRLQALRAQQAEEDEAYGLHATDEDRARGVQPLAELRKFAEEAIVQAKKHHAETVEEIMRRPVGGQTYRKAELDLAQKRNALAGLEAELAKSSDSRHSNDLNIKIRTSKQEIAAAEAQLEEFHRAIKTSKDTLFQTIKRAETTRDEEIAATKAGIRARIERDAAIRVDNLNKTIKDFGSAQALTADGKKELARLKEKLAAAQKLMKNPTPLDERARLQQYAEDALVAEGKLDIRSRVFLEVLYPGETEIQAAARRLKQAGLLDAERPFSKVVIDPLQLAETRRNFRAKLADANVKTGLAGQRRLDDDALGAIADKQARSVLKTAAILERRAQKDGDFSALASDSGSSLALASGKPGLKPALKKPAPAKQAVAKKDALTPAQIAANATITRLGEQSSIDYVGSLEKGNSAKERAESAIRARFMAAAMARAGVGDSKYRFSFASRAFGWAGKKAVLSKQSQVRVDKRVRGAIAAVRDVSNKQAVLKAHLQRMRIRSK